MIIDEAVQTVAAAMINDGASLSVPVDLISGRILSAIHVPAQFEGGYIELQSAPALAGAYAPVKDSSGNALRFTAGSSTVIHLTPDQAYGLRFIKLKSVDASGNAVAQTGDAALIVVAV